MRAFARHPAQRGTRCRCDENVRCCAKMRALARHPAQLGTRCCGDENLLCGAKKRALASDPAQRGTRCRVLTTTCGAARRSEHLQDIQHSSADSAVVVTKTCSAAQRCQHLLDIETAWHNVPLLPLLAECVRTTPGRISSSDSAENCENCENCGNCGNCDNCDNCDNWKNSFEMMENWGELQNCKD